MAATPSSSSIITLPLLFVLASETPPLHRRSAPILRSFESLRVAISLEPALCQLNSHRNNHHELAESLAEHHCEENKDFVMQRRASAIRGPLIYETHLAATLTTAKP
ncbi:hypothetical protein DEO72_LG10g2765 [Vigna unguiculata]|uniref:Secreted protein n=1 Tax=Vigna unguiculata TaxID=3917 RepID=A0A4D6NF38_VIGUN|nr:hypothetical protein DEO72_LG10g2765 [Vigna unguiculata]